MRFHIGFPAAVYEKLLKHCEKTGILRSEFIRRAVEAALKKEEKK